MDHCATRAIPGLAAWAPLLLGLLLGGCSGVLSGSPSDATVESQQRDAVGRDAQLLDGAAPDKTPPDGTSGDAGPHDAAAADMQPYPDEGWPSKYSPPTEATVLATLSKQHPRLVLGAAELARIQAYLATDPVAQGYHAALVNKAEQLLTTPVSKRELIGPRLLAVSREVVDRVYTLGLLYRLGGDKRYFQRARDELLAVSGFKDWNPSHFLDVAEMTHGVAIGYDWLYNDLSSSERSTIRTAIVELGLKPAQAAHQSNAWWTKSPTNWNNVCNGGTLVGALAVGDEAPAISRYVAHRAVANLPHGLASYAPDGAWPEGPAYWGYAMQYSVYAFAAMKTALGTDFGLSTLPGLSTAGLFRVAAVGPTGKFFNYSDCHWVVHPEPTLFWLARRYQQPLYAWSQREKVGQKGSAQDLMWYDHRGSQAYLLQQSPDSRFGGAEVVTLRSNWVDASATYVGFKGGDNQAGHAHLDLGSFVLDALGQRWVMDLGHDDYALPNYLGTNQDWTYYRLATWGHNTLVLNGANQDPQATAVVPLFKPGPQTSIAAVDLTQAYAPQGATRLWRGVALLADRQRVLVVDEIEASKSVSLVWGMHTTADVALSGTSATLTQGGKSLTAKVLSPSASWSQSAVNLAPPRKPTTGVKKLKLTLKTSTSSTVRIAVLFTPQGASGAAVKPRPLAQWEAQGPVE